MLGLLCVLFSVLTFSDQSPMGEAAARQVADLLQKQFGKSPRVLIATRDQPEDGIYVAALQRLLAESDPGSQPAEFVRGEPKDAREALVHRLHSDFVVAVPPQHTHHVSSQLSEKSLVPPA